jgi:hypothetical protein
MLLLLLLLLSLMAQVFEISGAATTANACEAMYLRDDHIQAQGCVQQVTPSTRAQDGQQRASHFTVF